MNSGGLLLSCEAARQISTYFTDTKMNNNVVLVYTTQVEKIAPKTTLSVTITN